MGFLVSRVKNMRKNLLNFIIYTSGKIHPIFADWNILDYLKNIYLPFCQASHVCACARMNFAHTRSTVGF